MTASNFQNNLTENLRVFVLNMCQTHLPLQKSHPKNDEKDNLNFSPNSHLLGGAG